MSFLKFSSGLAIVVGILMVAGGIWGICFTYKNVSRENIITPNDASIPGKHVRGPLTLKSQSDIIREHALRMADGKTYAEMPRMVPETDSFGRQVLDEKGEVKMIPNKARETWVTAMALITALNLAIVTYIFSFLILLFGFVSIWTGIIFYSLVRGR